MHLFLRQDKTVRSLDEFRSLLRRKFGNLSQAWKAVIDKESRGRLVFSEFCQACRDMGYGGPLRQLWKGRCTHIIFISDLSLARLTAALFRLSSPRSSSLALTLRRWWSTWHVSFHNLPNAKRGHRERSDNILS